MTPALRALTLLGVTVGLLVGGVRAETPPMDPAPQTVTWVVTLEVPGGSLPFLLDVEEGDTPRAWIRNDPERIAVPAVTWGEDERVIGMPHYDSRIVLHPDGDAWSGTWTKRRGVDALATVAVRAERGDRRFPALAAPDAEPVTGRWSVAFESDDEPAVGVFDVDADGLATGTFMTATGDYRFLTGRQDGPLLRLSCFDGGHAFLFDAKLKRGGSLAGDFWSGSWWHETWTARRDADAALADPFLATSWTAPDDWQARGFPDLDGRVRRLDDEAFGGRARVLHVFGSWCPNCHDASAEMVRLSRAYGPRGLSVLGLAFELTGDAERDANQVRVYAEQHGVEYPLLVAGRADKAEATRQLGLLDRVRSYPTTIFLTGEGEVRAVHTGFTGPATGAPYERLQRSFDAICEELLAEAEAAGTEPTGSEGRGG